MAPLRTLVYRCCINGLRPTYLPSFCCILTDNAMLTHWKKSITGRRVKAVVQSDGNTVADSAARGNDIQMVPVVCKLCLTPCHVDQMYILEHCLCSFCLEVVFVISVIIACWFPVLFFAARCYASAVLAMALCPSVCLSVTSRSSTKTAKCRITQTTPHDSPGTLVFWSQRSQRNSDQGHPLHGHQMQVGWVKISDFRQITGYISKTVQDRCMVSIKVE